jgi:flagellar motor switch/type III secretory pathway protein FliN
MCKDGWAMNPNARFIPYPWAALESLDRAAARRAGAVRRHVQRAVSLGKLEAALSATLHTEASVVPHRVRPGALPSRLPLARVDLELVDGSGRLVVGLDPDLASLMVGRVLGRPVQLESPGASLSAALSGALAAIVLEVGRRASHEVALRLAQPGSVRPGDDGLTVEASVVVAGRAYEATVWNEAPRVLTQDGGPDRSLELHGELPVSLSLVGGLCVTKFPTLSTLRPGDAWSCGDGWTLDRQGLGPAVLAAQGDNFGVAVTCVEGGQIVLRGERVMLPFDVEENQAMPEANATLTEALLDAPIVVRVEVGAVSMTVREWTKLGPGDVIETGRRIAEPVLLRVAGREVARGELVNVEGELGVRISELISGEDQSCAHVPG